MSKDKSWWDELETEETYLKSLLADKKFKKDRKFVEGREYELRISKPRYFKELAELKEKLKKRTVDTKAYLDKSIHKIIDEEFAQAGLKDKEVKE